MGGINGLAHRVYLDANVFIYAVEGYPTFKDRLRILLEAIDRRDIEAVTSELTLAEVLVKPFREGQPHWQEIYQQVLQPSPTLQLVPISKTLLTTAARIRARSNITLPDAIHAATSQQMQCGSFLTNDSS